MVSSKGLFIVALSGFAAVAEAAPHETGFFANARRWFSRRAHDLGRRDNSSNSTSTNSAGGGFVSAAYYANWDTDYAITDIPVENLSHITYAFADIATDGTVSSSDEGTDITNKLSGESSESGNNVYGNFGQLFLLKQKNRKLKTTLSIGGGGAPGWKSISTGSFTTTFVKTAVGMVSDFGFDGVDLDFEFPSDSNIEAYSKLIVALRTGLDNLAQEMNTTPFSISIAVAGDINDGKAYQDYIKDIDPAIDYWNVMAYDLCAANYQSTACDIGNLKGGSTSGSGTIQWFLDNGATASKMVLGAPLYGYVYEGTDGHGDSYDQSMTPKGDGVNGPGGYGVKLLPLSSMKNAQITQDTDTGASWAYDSSTKTLASYDTTEIAQLKANYVMQQSWAGAMYWEISSDNTGSKSLVSQYANTFSKGVGLHSACNHINYPKSQYDNIKNGMGNTPASCDDSTPNVTSSSSSGDGGSNGSSSNSTSTSNSDSTTDDSSSDDSGSTGSSQSCQATSARRRRAKRNHKKRLAYTSSS